MQNKDINYLTAGYEIKQNTNAHQLQYLESPNDEKSPNCVLIDYCGHEQKHI